MKTLTVIFISSCLCLAHSERVQKWGYQTSIELGRKTIVAAPMLGYHQVRAFSFSGDVKPNLRIPIVGMKYLDNAAHPVNVTFIYGEVMRQEIALLLKSEIGHGINSTFIFYRM